MVKKLLKNFKLKKGTKPFYYNLISFETWNASVKIKDFKLSTNPFGLIYQHFAPFTFQFSSIDVEFLNHTNAKVSKRTKSVRENIFLQLFLQLFAIFVKKIYCFSDKIRFKYRWLEYEMQNPKLLLQENSKKLNFKFEMGNSKFIIKDLMELNFKEFEFNLKSDSDPILSLLNFEVLAIPFDFQIPVFEFNLNGNDFDLKPFSFGIILPRGTINIKIPAIFGDSSLKFPTFKLILNDLSGFISRSLFDIPKLVLNITKISVSSLKLYHENLLILGINNLSSERQVSAPWTIALKEILLNYHTKVGIEIISFYMKSFSEYIKSSLSKEKSPLALPQFNLNVTEFSLNMKFTDSAKMNIKSNNILLSDRNITIPIITVYINDVSIFILKKLMIKINNNEFLQIAMDILHFHDRKIFYLEDFCLQFLYSWRSIAPFILTHNLDKETLPFPLILTFNKIVLKFHDSKVHSSISRANRLLPNTLKDSFVRQFILTKKIKESNFSDSVFEDTLEHLKSLEFNEYLKKIKNTKSHKFSFKAIFINASLSFDSRGMAEKVSLIHHFDPAVKEYYPNIKWETMLGANFVAKWDKMEVYSFDIEKPIIFATDVCFQGPTILAEAKNETFVNLSYKIDGETIESSKNPIKMRMFSEMVISADEFYYYFGDCFQPIYQEMMITIASIWPNGVDPSKRLNFVDNLRTQFRGQYLFKSRIWECRYPAKNDYRNLDDYMPIKVIKFHFLWREGNSIFNGNRLMSPRIYNGKEGPISVDLPKITWTFKFHFVTDGKEDPRKFIVFPDVSKFGEKDYDSYEHFRAKEIIMDDSTLSFSEAEVLPNITTDIAHFEWFWAPLMYFSSTSRNKCQYSKKLGFRNIPKLPIKYLIEYKREGTLRIIADCFVVRIFDHFPVDENGSIEGSSVDFRLNNFTMTTQCDMTYERNIFKSKFRCDSFTINATDFGHYSKDISRKTPTMIIMKPFNVDFGEKILVKIDEISLHFNQLLLQYINDFMFTAENLRAKYAKPKPFQDLSAFDLPVEKLVLTSQTIKIYFTSLKCDSQVVSVFINPKISLLTSQDGLNSAVRFVDEELKLFTNAKDPQINEEYPLIIIKNIEAMFSNRYVLFRSSSFAAYATPEEISALNFLQNECFGGDSKSTPTLKKNSKQFKIVTKIPSFKVNLRAESLMESEFEFENVELCHQRVNDGSIESSIQINSVKVSNLTKDALFPEVLSRWTQQPGTRNVRPHIQIQVKMSQKFKGAWIFPQAEVNMEPIIICYDAQFWDSLASFFKHQFVVRPKFGKPFSLSIGNQTQMPFQFYDQSIFPPIKTTINFSTSKSLSISKKELLPTTIMFRYFRLNPIILNTTYRNEENKILSEINSFQGQIHEIIYHDLSTTILDFLGKLKSDIASDIIPQFLKHIVGFRQNGLFPEQEIEEWLSTDDSRLTQRDKQRFLLFGTRALRKK